MSLHYTLLQMSKLQATCCVVPLPQLSILLLLDLAQRDRAESSQRQLSE